MFIELEHRKLGRVENLIAKLAVAFHTQNLEVDIATLKSRTKPGLANKVVTTKHLPPPE